MPNIKNKAEGMTCFVCETSITDTLFMIHSQVHLPLCLACKETNQEKDKVKELLEGLAEDLGIGCI
ncbi:hypothetical protein [Carboxylicivirga sp. N1Y90]|uniref:hypothetical protein n=1 Tax=Carboxylicivirga fragile TaxID=3417571 RepID=UPI003D33A9BF|nr:hypothetical protein [Marinilabiliaceae bacterium N1Y90]